MNSGKIDALFNICCLVAPSLMAWRKKGLEKVLERIDNTGDDKSLMKEPNMYRVV